MNEIPHLDDAMWAFDDAGLPYPQVPVEPEQNFVPTLPPESTLFAPEMPSAEVADSADMAISIPSE